MAAQSPLGWKFWLWWVIATNAGWFPGIALGCGSSKPVRFCLRRLGRGHRLCRPASAPLELVGVNKPQMNLDVIPWIVSGQRRKRVRLHHRT